MYNKFVYKATKEGAFFFVKAINFHTSLQKRKTWKEEEELSKYLKHHHMMKQIIWKFCFKIFRKLVAHTYRHRPSLWRQSIEQWMREERLFKQQPVKPIFHSLFYSLNCKYGIYAVTMFGARAFLQIFFALLKTDGKNSNKL